MTDRKTVMPLLRPLPFKDDEDHRRWQFEEDWVYYGWKFPILIPKGYIINGASVPKLFSNIFASTGILFLGSIPHDFGYDKGYLLNYYGWSNNDVLKVTMTRQELDDMFGEISRIEYPRHTWAINKAEWLLELGGGSTWDECRKKDGTYVEPEPEKVDANGDWVPG